MVINEVQTTIGETRWLELANLTGSAIDLAGYTLEFSWVLPGFSPGTILAANGCFAVCLANATDALCEHHHRAGLRRRA